MKVKQFFNTTNKQLIWVGVASAILIAVCGSGKEEMTVKVTASPRIAVLTLKGVKVDVMVTVKNPTPKMECISLAFVWQDGSVSKQEPTCEDDDHPKLWTEFKDHVYHRRGKFTITVYFYHGNDLYYKDEAYVEILGDE